MLETSWLILLYTLPAKQASTRLSVWRQLKRLGAISLKTSAFILPDRPEHEESFQWLAQSVRQNAGDATLLRAAQIDTLSDREVIDLFQETRASDYREILDSIKTLRPAKSRKTAPDAAEVERLKSRYQAVRRIDFFDSPLAQEVANGLNSLLPAPLGISPKGPKVKSKNYQNRQWQTRPRPELDRVASAWLIRHHIDPVATFVFSHDRGAFPDAVSYDMVHADFGHEGDECTFETLVRRFGLRSKGLAELAAIIHAADVEDGKFSKVEGLGLLAVLRGWGQMGLPDDEILQRGLSLMDGLHQSVTGG